jgi:hypothetical protein
MATDHRFVEFAIAATVDGHNAGGLIASFDRFDRRIRVLDAASLDTTVMLALLDKLAAWRDLTATADTPPPILVLDVRADATTLLAGLERGGYIPTTLHPGLLMATPAGRPGYVDVFRYELLSSQPFTIPESVRHWPEACAIASDVIQSCQDLPPALPALVSQAPDRK